MIYTLGESLLDIIFDEGQKIIANAGGGMLNTSISLSRAGIEVSLISELGDDQTATTIIGFLKQNKVYAKYIKKYYQQNTSIALAHLDENKKPTFSIYKSYPSKRQLVKPSSYTNDDVLVFGSLYSIDPAVRNDIKEIATFARQSGSIIIYDPNIRSHNLEDSALRTALFENISYADIVKASDEDMRNIFGEMPFEMYYQKIKRINKDVLFILTLGEVGAIGYYNNLVSKIPANKVNVVSTIGAGDAFNAGIVHFLQKNSIKKQGLINPGKKIIEGLLHSGTKFSSRVCASNENYLPINAL